jgi:hypothetical protein
MCYELDGDADSDGSIDGDADSDGSADELAPGLTLGARLSTEPPGLVLALGEQAAIRAAARARIARSRFIVVPRSGGPAAARRRQRTP